MTNSISAISSRPYAGPRGDESGWLYRQIYLAPRGTPFSAALLALGDSLLVDSIGAWAAEWLAQGWSSGWFFIRYAEDGYHLRLRIHGPLSALSGPVQARLDTGLLEFFGANAAGLGLHRPPERSADLVAAGHMRPAEYQPEYAKYGGPAGMRLAEQHFFASSQASLRVLASERVAGTSRSMYALELIRALLEAYGASPAEQALLLHSHADYWLRVLPAADQAAFAANLEVQYQRRKATLAQRLGAGPGLEQTAACAPVFASWREHLADNFRQLRQLEAAGQISSPLAGHLATFDALAAARRLGQTPVSSFVIALNYLHLLLNRLGLHVGQEIQLVYLLYRHLEDCTGQPSPSLPLLLEPPN